MRQENTFVIAAQVAAKLYFAMKVAEELNLTAKNAHAISARAGQQSAGFRAITSYIGELAENTISAAKKINREAIAVANMASQRQRAMVALSQYAKVRKLAPDAQYIGSIAQPTLVTQQRLAELDKEFLLRIKQLCGEVQYSQQQIRAAATIASTSKVEATMAGSFQSQLEVIAQNITRSAEEIRGHLVSAQSLLTTALNTLNRGERVA